MTQDCCTKHEEIISLKDKFLCILFFSSRQKKLLLSHWLIALYIRANVFLACGCLFLKQLGALQLWPGFCYRPEHCLLRRLTRRWHGSQPGNSFSSAFFVLRLGRGRMRATLPLPPPSIFPYSATKQRRWISSVLPLFRGSISPSQSHIGCRSRAIGRRRETDEHWYNQTAEGGGGKRRDWGDQADSLKIYHPFTFSQTHSQSHCLNTRKTSPK